MVNKLTVFVSSSAADSVEMKMVKQGSLTAVLNNEIHLSFSFYGPTGQCIGITHVHMKHSAL